MYDRDTVEIRIGSKQEWLDSFERDFIAWGGSLSKDEYAKREDMLEKTPFAQNMTYWVMVPRVDRSTVLCTCEVYATDCLVVPTGCTDDAVTRRAYNLSGLFTPVKSRGMGLGSLMTTLLWERVRLLPLIYSPTAQDCTVPTLQASRPLKPSCRAITATRDRLCRAGPGRRSLSRWRRPLRSLARRSRLLLELRSHDRPV
jgi:hypothetical protein